MIFGYARISTNVDKQSFDRQTDALKKYGADEIIKEAYTGTKKSRPELDQLFAKLRKGDKIVVTELTRLGRNLKDLIILAEEFEKIGVELISLKENIDTTTATGRLLFQMMGVLAEFERDLIVDRVKQGLESARARGRIGGRKPLLKSKINDALKLYDTKEIPIAKITELTGVSKSCLYKYVKERQKDKEDK
ncbi:recombinase family protein [Clostridium sp. CS001]|uniref:recombinase family protein n=1 Tax=Clostridium sp. CS001 TaxID=2880648 RepID=UPI001CF37869|nr:recombinase family protein [Clostridium sp. CS001]MCB2289750.1 recombinase family protein [Clostridium sp. CS001]